jgi:hypothetical protein
MRVWLPPAVGMRPCGSGIEGQKLLRYAIVGVWHRGARSFLGMPLARCGSIKLNSWLDRLG